MENGRRSSFALKGLVSDFLEGCEAFVACADPVAMIVRRDGSECVRSADPLNGSVGGDLVQLFLARRIVLRLRVEDFGGTCVCRVLDENGGCDPCLDGEDVSAFPFRGVSDFASDTATQVVDEDLGELFLQRHANAVRRVAVHEGAVGHEGDDAAFPDAVRRPAKRTEVRVVEAVLVGSR